MMNYTKSGHADRFWTPALFNSLLDFTLMSLDDLYDDLRGTISMSALLAFSAGEALPSADELIKLSTFFGAPLDLLLGRVSEQDFKVFLANRGSETGYRFRCNLTSIRNQYYADSSYLAWPFNLLAEVNEYGCLPVDYAPTDDILAGINYALDRLPGKIAERRKQEILMYYRDGCTLKEIADTYGVSKEVVRQQLLKSLRCIRSNPLLRRAVLFGLSFVERENNLARQRKLLIAREAEMEHLLEESERKLAKMRESSDSTPLDAAQRALSLKIDELGLSVRTYNALKRAGINNLEDLKNYIYTQDGTSRLMCTRNLGVKSAREILQKVYDLTGFNWSGQPSADYRFEFDPEI